MNNDLKEINFNKILILDTNIHEYNHDKYLELKRHPIKGFCTKCEENNFNKCPKDNSYILQNISHGASALDFIYATDQKDIDFNKWHNDGVLFLMEGPSIDWGIYEANEYNNYVKKPTKEWYWVHGKQKSLKYPQEFKGAKYGSLFNSIIFTFKLKNAYLTNFIKCGLNNEKNKYKGIDSYDPKCLKTCYENILYTEIDALKPKVIFCFGSKVETYLKKFYSDESVSVIGLPHPAGQRRGFKDTFYRHLYFSKIMEGLYKSGIIGIEEARDKIKYFLTGEYC